MRGTAAIERAKEERKAKQGQFSGVRRFRLEDGESAVVRFLETGDDIVSAYVHHVPNPNPKSRVPIKLVCRDQDPETGARIGAECPGCEDDDVDVAKRRLQGAINLIWRDGPVFEKDKDGRIVVDNRNRWIVSGREDQITVWTSGPNVFDELTGLDVDIPGGLVSRDFKVSRKGDGFDTEYTIRPADIDGGPKKLSKADEKLVEGKYDLTEFEVPPPYDDWWGRARPQTQNKTSGSRPSFDRQVVPADVSPFMNDED